MRWTSSSFMTMRLEPRTSGVFLFFFLVYAHRQIRGLNSRQVFQFWGRVCLLCIALQIFTARRICIAHTMLLQDVCPFIRLSHTDMLSKELNISSKFFYCRVATLFQFFHAKRYGNTWTGTTLTGHRMQAGYEIITIFASQHLHVSLKR